MKKTYIYSTVLIITMWSISALLINNDIILPSVFDVLITFKNIIDKEFVKIIIISISRTLIAIAISFSLALLLASIAYFNKIFEDFFHIFYVILKTIPTIAIMIICLLWFGREGSIIIIVMLIAFPIIYSNILFAYKNIDKSLILNTNTYEDEFFIKYQRIYLPLIRNNIFESIKNTLSLGFKVTVMAEVMAQIGIGIGHELYFAKINLEMSYIFAWTIIMIVISMLFDYILNIIINRYKYE